VSCHFGITLLKTINYPLSTLVAALPLWVHSWLLAVMPIEITIPRLGWSMEEANFVSWLKQDGEPVKSGEPLFTLESEKATQEIEAIDCGILRIRRDGPKAGDVVKVGQAIGDLIGENETAEREVISSTKSAVGRAKAAGPEADSKSASRNSISPSEELPQTVTAPAISPRARRVATELGVDATRLRGTGRTGRIIEKDVRAAAKSGEVRGG